MRQRFEIWVICVWAITFAVAGTWSHFSSDPFPLAGLRNFAQSEELNIALQVTAVLVAAGCLLFPRWQTRKPLLVFHGMAVVLFLLGFIFIGVPFGLAFACFAGIAKGRSVQAPIAK